MCLVEYVMNLPPQLLKSLSQLLRKQLDPARARRKGALRCQLGRIIFPFLEINQNPLMKKNVSTTLQLTISLLSTNYQRKNMICQMCRARNHDRSLVFMKEIQMKENNTKSTRTRILRFSYSTLENTS